MVPLYLDNTLHSGLNTVELSASLLLVVTESPVANNVTCDSAVSSKPLLSPDCLPIQAIGSQSGTHQVSLLAIPGNALQERGNNVVQVILGLLNWSSVLLQLPLP